MAGYEQVPESSALEKRPSKPKESAREREELQERIEGLRNSFLDDLLRLEAIRNARRRLKPSDIETLDLLVATRPPLLDPQAMQDMRDQLTVEEETRDMAASAISFIELLNDEERRLRKHAGASGETLKREAAVREQHVNVLKQEWGIQ
ncbi:hypothetical protein KJZ71_01925 [Patescibacteria group bacterium]|uniref:Uncharacterized protein n=1 Tax=candidate division WWE3 bacterium TaxID=2053526 RepID=A0A928Y6R0_UNCKA|nr:hypothetical protein [candidate division WWE3 bacterium]MCL4732546.1 hypothetical protein [Patescibacteria group bacterium]MDL1953265.1 hypothetical protein [Candidatus Uhrbacteria bacterium UHB]RIL00926.1 MAG: hypothetical protein DCC77_00055 [Candidatus Uhrbacteria bacterium]